MNRTVKFSGKSLVDIGNIKKGDWVYGGIAYDADRVWIDMEYYGQILVDKDTVGQFTGLYDNAKKKYMNGDIVQIEYKDIKFKGLVKYDETYLAYVIINTNTTKHEFENLGDYLDYDIEVIGNATDTPELLGGE